jgi:2,5-furandicarboxylate decarboxylase 1
MTKNIRTFLEDLKREAPDELAIINKKVDPANYEVTAIIKHLQDRKKFPVLLFENPLNLKGEANEFRFITNIFSTKRKIEIALGMPKERKRTELVEELLKREEKKLKPVVIGKKEAPVKEVIHTGDEVDLMELPIMKHYEMDGGPYIVLASIGKDREKGNYNVSYHRMEVKKRNLTSFFVSPNHMWKIFKGYEEKNEECPVATVLGHHPAFYLGACYRGPFEMEEYEIIGDYLQEPLRLVPSETYQEKFLVPADAEIIIEGALLPGKRLEEGPFGDTLGYVGSKKYQNSLWYEVRAITHRKNAIYESLLTPDEDKPWLDLAQEAAYFRRIKEAIPTVIAVFKGGRYAHYNVFISIKKMNEGDPGRAAAAALSFTHTKNVFVFDEDIDIFNPTEILWALATRVQPHKNIQIIKPLMRGDTPDPSLGEEKVTSVMIVDATKPLNQAYPLLSKCPDKVKTRINLEDYIPREVLNSIPVDRTSYWG